MVVGSFPDPPPTPSCTTTLGSVSIFLSRLFSWMRVRVSHADTPAAEAMANVEIAVTAYQGTCFMNSITSFTGSSSLAEVEINLRRGPKPRQDDDIDTGAGAGRGRGSDCADVREAQLAAILSLDLDAQGLTKLAAGVFEGLRSLTNLHLPRNGTTELEPGTFDGLTSPGCRSVTPFSCLVGEVVRPDPEGCVLSSWEARCSSPAI